MFSGLEIRLPANQSVRETLTEIPESARAVLAEGFRHLPKLDQASQVELVRLARDAVIHSVSEDELAASLKTSPENAKALLSAVSFLAYTLAMSKEPSSEVVKAMLACGVVAADSEITITQFCDLLTESQQAIRLSLEKQRLASTILPSLVEFSAVVDLRFRFDKGKVGICVPVIVGHLDTDTHEEVWFQLTKRDLERLVNELQETLKHVAVIEEWIPLKEPRGQRTHDSSIF